MGDENPIRTLRDYSKPSHEGYRNTIELPVGNNVDDMIRKINILWKTVFEKLDDVSTLRNAGNSMAPKSIASISHVEREELRKKGIKSPSKLFFPKYLSFASIKELNKNFSALKCVHFVNSIIILSKDSDTKEEDVSSTNAHEHELESMVMRREEQRSKLKNPQLSCVKAKIRAENPSNAKISCMIRHILKKHAYIDIGSPIIIMSRNHYNQIMTYKLGLRKNPSNPNKVSNFVGKVRGLRVFIGIFAYKCDSMILEDTTGVIDGCLGEFVFGKPFIEEISLVYNKKEGTITFSMDNKKIYFKIPHTMEIFKQTGLMGLSTDSIPSSAYEENFGHGRTHYYQSLHIGDEYKHDGGERRGIRHLMRLEKEMMGQKGESRKNM
nr:protein kinase-like domain, concanavalin A-like lectin/glucanase domain protein [Tanacetum cinerariifolium]GEY86733.1 protein kinase-like domain, concanavalin A-like lectin/glucanase domain protein [Tanacetum cinerariifolium]